MGILKRIKAWYEDRFNSAIVVWEYPYFGSFNPEHNPYDDAESYCGECDYELPDEYWNYCPKCGKMLIWHEPPIMPIVPRIFKRTVKGYDFGDTIPQKPKQQEMSDKRVESKRKCKHH